MSRFVYQALDADGARVSGEVDAFNTDDAIARLQASGLFPLHTAPSTDHWKTDTLKPDVRMRFLRDLHAFIDAGLPLDRALSLLEARSTDKAAKRLAHRLSRQVRAGSSLGDALDGTGQGLGAAAHALLGAGERAGQLNEALKALAETQARDLALRRSVMTALSYPLVVMGVAAAAVLILLTFVLPRFEGVFETMNRPVPFGIALLMGFGKALATWGPLALLAAGLGLGLAMFRLGKDRLVARAMAWAARLPVIGPYRTALARERSTRVLSLLIKGGVPLAEALPYAADAASHPQIAEAWRRAADEVRAGRSVSGALRTAPGMTADAAELTALGEETGGMA